MAHELITTANQLDALPIGSIVVDAYAATCIRARVSDPRLPSDWVRVTLAVKGGEHHHSPFLPADVVRVGWSGWPATDAEPARTLPSVEDVARVLCAADMETIDYERRYREGGEPVEYLPDARAVLALLPGRPEAAVKAEALREAADELTPVYAIEGAAASHLRAIASRYEAEVGERP